MRAAVPPAPHILFRRTAGCFRCVIPAQGFIRARLSRDGLGAVGTAPSRNTAERQFLGGSGIVRQACQRPESRLQGSQLQDSCSRPYTSTGALQKAGAVVAAAILLFGPFVASAIGIVFGFAAGGCPVLRRRAAS